METSSINAVGIWFYSLDTQRYLYLMRNDPRHPNAWGLPGGKIESNETLIEAMNRECVEELGFWPHEIKLIPIEKFTSDTGNFEYHTYVITVDEEFVPELNGEHRGYCWVPLDDYPKPLHPGVWRTFKFSSVIDKLKTVEQLS